MRPFRIFLTALAGSFSVAVAAQDVPIPPMDDGSGATGWRWWYTSYGRTTLPSEPFSGQRIDTSYSQDGGKFRGVIRRQPDGTWIYTGEWEEDSSARDCGIPGRYSPGVHWGKIVFRFDARFENFTGKWGYCGEAPDRGWTGKLDASSTRINPPPRRSASIPDEPKCDWRGYFAFVRDRGDQLIREFEQKTALHVEGDDEHVVNSKLFPYERAGFVSYDENEIIAEMEKLANQMILNQGADNWLSDNRKGIIEAYDNANREYWQSALSKEECPGFVDQAGQTPLLPGIATGQASGIRGERFLPELRDKGLEIEARYIADFYRKMGKLGSITDMLKAKAKASLAEMLADEGVSEAQTVRLQTELEKQGAQIASIEADGTEITYAMVRNGTQTAFQKAGLKPPPDSYFEQSLIRSAKESAPSVASWAITSMLSYAVPKGKLPSLTRFGYLTTALDHIEVGKAMVDLDTLRDLYFHDLGTTNAVREDVGHMKVLIRRYELFYAEYEKLEEAYRAMFAEAQRRFATE